MSTSFPATGRVKISTNACNRTLDWGSPFWTLTMAFVFAGAASVLRMAFASHVKWAEAFAFIGIVCWRYLAHSIGLFPWHLKSSKSGSFKFPSLPQGVLNGLALFVLYLVILNSFGDSRGPFAWIAAAAGAFFVAFLSADPVD